MRRLVASLVDVRPVWSAPEWVYDALRAALPDGWELVELRDPADGRGDGGAPDPRALEAVRGAEVYVGPGFPLPLLRAARGSGDALRWVHSLTAGVGGTLYPEMRADPAVLTNSAGIHAEPMAETVVAMILHFARGLDLAVRAQGAREWRQEPFFAADTPVREVAGSTVGIVGLGGIGRAVARRALALGARVVATRRSPAPGPEGVEVLAGGAGLRALLRRSDFLVVALPETAETRGLLGAAELALLPAGAVVVNVGRGSALDEEALARALHTGRLRGAALDVFEREPLGEGSPLWALPNVLVTPHVSPVSRGFWPRQWELLRQNLERYLAGAPLLNTVDKTLGY